MEGVFGSSDRTRTVPLNPPLAPIHQYFGTNAGKRKIKSWGDSKLALNTSSQIAKIALMGASPGRRAHFQHVFQ